MFKKTIKFNSKKVMLPDFDYRMIIYLTLFLCGLIIGCFAVAKGDSSFLQAPKGILSSYLKAKCEIGFFRDFLNLFSIFSVLPLAIYLFGLCAVGAPFVFICTAFFGISSGFYISLIIESYGSKGVAFAALAVIPGIALTLTSFIKSCSLASNMSLSILSMLRDGVGEKAKASSLIDYSKSYLPKLLPTALGAAVNAVSFTLFGSLFGFI